MMIRDKDIPPLAPGEGSWVIYRRSTGLPVLEVMKPDRRKLLALNPDAAEVVPYLEHVRREKVRAAIAKAEGRS